MASFVNMNLNSDSESDDTDFVPEGGKYSEDSGSDAENIEKNKLRKRQCHKSTKRKGGIFLDEEIHNENQTDISRKDEFEEEKIERKELEDKKKADDLWADFKKEASDTKNVKWKSAGSTNPPSKTSGGLGSFGSIGQAKKKTIKPPSVVKKSHKDIMSSIFGDIDKSIDKNRDNKSEEPSLSNSSECKPKSIISSIFENDQVLEKINTKQTEKAHSNIPKIASEYSELESAKDSISNENMITITKNFDFAGENVEVTKQVDKDSKEGKSFLKSEKQKEMQMSDKNDLDSKKRSAKGLSSIIGTISGKKPKMGCLDKSKMDWEKFVSDQNIREELKTYNKGKDGYVEKQLFLERADYRRFEIEKEAREKTRKPLNN